MLAMCRPAMDVARNTTLLTSINQAPGMHGRPAQTVLCK